MPIRKGNGGTRWLRIPCVRDRVVQSAAHRLLSEGLEPEFEAWSFGYRPGRSAAQAIALAQEWLGAGFTHVIDADIENFFDSVPHRPLLDLAKTATADPDLCELVYYWLDTAAPMGVGLPQGSPISPILANLYLDELDEVFSGHGARMVRFADDFLIFLRSPDDARRALRRLTAFMENSGLRLHPEKTRLVPPGEVLAFLGGVVGRAVVNPERPVLAPLGDVPDLVAEDPALAKAVPPAAAGPLFLFEPNRRLSRTHQSFVVQDTGTEVARIHAGLVQRIEVGPSADIDSDALRLAIERGIPVTLLSESGMPEARVHAARERHGARHLAQARACLDPARSTHLAAALVQGRINGQKQLLYDIRHALRRSAPEDPRAEEVRRAARNLTRLIRQLQNAESVAQVLQIEARAAAIYWTHYGMGLSEGFELSRRARRERTSPTALLLDLASALLLREVEAAVLGAGLHPGFGVLHVASDRGQPCVWDLAEPFRVPVAETAVRLAVNQGRRPSITLADFVRDGDQFRLLPTGREAMIRAQERVLRMLSEDHRTGQRTSWRERIRREAQAFARAFETGEPFIASEKR
ncbi:CRISPR-associated endonuclease Cas1 [Rhodobacteraceae bacterium 2376]|uniref:CRISPR-associated endonuclease Cas1 n=1 Tax=Rhabdonatronobacter sediminivivens TaxID=2743469 RepID=A0A7Z0KYW6_9RHOB|nr:CRISPR-associated endonuclease Cas1 [Rhabdonatronobacter sediminivivens]NYS26047.1 CRISPR-associated endonuclease Cas1 [Rhabdonatronobacter sediminivivens]